MNLKKSVVLRSVLITLGALAVFAAVAGGLISYYNKEAAKKELYRTYGVFEQILSKGVALEDAVRYGTAVPDLRVTVIAEDGTVLADSNANTADMDSHAGREEIAGALSGKEVFTVRVSSTLNVRMMYYAKRLALEGSAPVVLRLAIPMSSLNGYAAGSIATLAALTVVVGLLSYAAALGVYRRVTRPYTIIKKGLRNINDGNYTEIMPRFKDDELNETLSEINGFAERIRSAVSEKEAERAKLDYILDNMRQGIVVVNGAREVALINKSAAEALGAGEAVTGRDLMFATREPALLRAVERALEHGVSAAFDYCSGVRVYAVGVTRLLAAWATGADEYAAVVTLTDVTEVREAERARSEFFANASHELKTPLTSVKGFSELLNNDMVRDPAKVREYTGRIAADSDRMLALIDDMLKLSRLDEGERPPAESVDLAEVLREVAADLSVEAEKKRVAVNVEAPASVCILADRELMRELITNLMGNAVKYNREGGTVTARAFRGEDGRTVVAVEDTGIGIPEEHQSRVFERFYRVDRGRSRSAGGTGLGLAIVKHIAAIYGAEITLKSAPGEGTDIRVAF